MNQPPLRLDAYLDWMLRTHLSDDSDRQGQWVFLLLELHERALDFARLAAESCQDSIRVPEHYSQPPLGLENSRFCTAIVHPHFLQALARGNNTPQPMLNQAQRVLMAQIKRFELGCLVSPWAVQNGSGIQPYEQTAAPQTQTAASSTASTVVIGVIDDGLAFANERFCHVKDGVRKTRFLALWDQDAAPHTSCWHHGQSHSRDDLNAYLSSGHEDAAYTKANYKAVKPRVTHGTHVLDLACGQAPDKPLDEAPNIVGVQLPLNAILDTTCGSAAPYILDGLRYVLHHADRAALGGKSEVIINLSFGDLAGPHDGSSLIERAFDELIQQRRKAGHGCHIVMAAGNSYLSRCHARITVLPGQAVTLPWHIQPDDATPNFLELWPRLENGKALDLKDLEISLSAPRGHLKLELRGDSSTSTLSSQAHPEALVALHPHPANGDGPMGLVVIAPTQHAFNGCDAAAIAPCGDWQLMLHNHGQQPLVCQAYIQRDDISFGRPRLGRQSFFNDPAYECWDERGDMQLQDQANALVKRSGTLNSLASGRLVDVVGSVDAQGKPAPYSSLEELDNQEKPKRGAVHVMAITDASRARPGILATGTRSASVVALRGTSMAAPQLTRALAQGYLSDTPLAASAREVTDHDGQKRSLVSMTGLAQQRAERR